MPCIVFIDEFDAIAPVRGTGSSGGTVGQSGASLVSQLLVTLDGAQGRLPEDILVLTATNRLDAIDAAIRRRFSCVEVPLPTLREREQLLLRTLAAHSHCISTPEIKRVAKLMDRTYAHTYALKNHGAQEAPTRGKRNPIEAIIHPRPRPSEGGGPLAGSAGLDEIDLARRAMENLTASLSSGALLELSRDTAPQPGAMPNEGDVRPCAP
ncbi:hypothetical protein OC842_006251 [Tilletia horrida]|uniref:ATPase AAA-type core domain-containing protein n=1 Tax=Tilletia horrida TaxID=155126 RepID=A0AAN6G5U4_9BASI|nr:hypothetical protein OC842_006251 [Tilletia horrida]KAK0541907.1 hypothetical protein OC844_007937 [Tilletia horrida]